MEPQDPMDEMDVRDAVRTSGQALSPAVRAELRDRVEAALRGETVVSVAPAAPLHRHRRLAVAAVLVAAGVVAGVVALADDDPGTVTPATLPATTEPTATESSTEPTTVPTAGPTTTGAPTTVVGTTIAPWAPLPSERTISVDSDLGNPLVGPSVIASKRVAAAFFQDDGWVTWDRIDRGQPTTVTMFDLDGVEQWSVAVLGRVQGLDRTGSIEIGPLGVLYAYYEGEGPQGIVAAVPIDGARAGEVVATWDVAMSCFETFCGPPLAETGVTTANEGVAPFVGPQGELLEASFTAPLHAEVQLGQGPAIPNDWPAQDENGNNLSSWRTTVTFSGTTWEFDAVGVNTQEGQYLAQWTFGGRSVLVWFRVSNGAGVLATRSQMVLGDLALDGSMMFLPLPDDVVYVRDDPQRLGYLVTLYDQTTQTYALARLLFSD